MGTRVNPYFRVFYISLYFIIDEFLNSGPVKIESFGNFGLGF